MSLFQIKAWLSLVQITKSQYSRIHSSLVASCLFYQRLSPLAHFPPPAVSCFSSSLSFVSPIFFSSYFSGGFTSSPLTPTLIHFCLLFVFLSFSVRSHQRFFQFSPLQFTSLSPSYSLSSSAVHRQLKGFPVTASCWTVSMLQTKGILLAMLHQKRKNIPYNNSNV